MRKYMMWRRLLDKLGIEQNLSNQKEFHKPPAVGFHWYLYEPENYSTHFSAWTEELQLLKGMMPSSDRGLFRTVLEHDEQAVSYFKLNILGSERAPLPEELKTSKSLQSFIKSLDPVKIRYTSISGYSNLNSCTIKCAEQVSAAPGKFEYVYGFILYTTSHQNYHIAKGHVWLKDLETGEWVDPTPCEALCEDVQRRRLLVESKSYLTPGERRMVKMDPYAVRLGALTNRCIGELAGAKNVDPVFYYESFNVNPAEIRLGNFERSVRRFSDRELHEKAGAVLEKWHAPPKARRDRHPLEELEISKMVKFGKIDNFQRGDVDMFLLNRSVLPGAQPNRTIMFPNGGWNFVLWVQVQSDMAYAVRNYVLDEPQYRAVRFSTYQIHGSDKTFCHFYPRTNLFDHHKDESILDTIHTDLIDPSSGKSSVDVDRILSDLYVGPTIEHLFLRSLPEDKVNKLSDLIDKCENLRTLVLTNFRKKRKLNKHVFRSIAERGEKLEGLHIWHCQVSSSCTSRILQDTIAACPKLKWLGLEIPNVHLHTSFFESLPSTLEVLWISCCPNRHKGYYEKIKQTITTSLEIKLKFMMIDPDPMFNSVLHVPTTTSPEPQVEEFPLSPSTIYQDTEDVKDEGIPTPVPSSSPQKLVVDTGDHGLTWSSEHNPHPEAYALSPEGRQHRADILQRTISASTVLDHQKMPLHSSFNLFQRNTSSKDIKYRKKSAIKGRNAAY